MTTLNVKLIDLYEIMKPLQRYVQKPNDIHFNFKGQVIMSNAICNRLKQLYF